MLTQSKLKDELSYDKDTGKFTRLKDKGRLSKNGDIAGTLGSLGYTIIKIQGKAHKAHRLAWLYMYGTFPSKNLDHINGIKDDNRIENLRECTQQENCYNRQARKGSKSGIKNVCWHKRTKTWHVVLSFGGVCKFIGQFKDLELAELVAIEARIKYHKEYAKL